MATAFRAVIFGSQIPSYTPTDAGTADLTGLPSDLPGVAGWCHDKAVDAQGPSLSEAEQGSLLKSIRDGINKDPGGYKKLAGI